MMFNNFEKNEQYYLDITNEFNTELLYEKDSEIYTLYYENNKFAINYHDDMLLNISYTDCKEI